MKLLARVAGPVRRVLHADSATLLREQQFSSQNTRSYGSVFGTSQCVAGLLAAGPPAPFLVVPRPT
jgi:hypothetical protein